MVRMVSTQKYSGRCFVWEIISKCWEVIKGHVLLDTRIYVYLAYQYSNCGSGTSSYGQ